MSSYTNIEIVERFLRLGRGELIDMIVKLEKENIDLQIRFNRLLNQN